MATLDRSTHLCHLNVYYPGQGDPVLDDRGFVFYDVLEESFPYSSSSRNSLGYKLLEYIKGVGVVNAGYLSLKNTRSSHFTTSGGTWEEVRPDVGSGFKYRYFQVDTTADLQWSATTVYDLPANPEFALSLSFAATPSDHDAAAYPPYLRIEFGGNPAVWAMEWSKVYGPRLLLRTGGSWQAVSEISELEPNKDTDEAFVYIRCLRGRILVSMDYGRTWQSHGDDETPLTVQAGKLVFRGQGNAAGIGIHQLEMAAGVLTSSTRNTFTSRALTVTPTISGRYDIPSGANIVFADNSTPLSGIAGYTATLTPTTTSTVAFDFYSSPALYSVLFEYPVVRKAFTGLGYFTRPFANLVYDVSIDKPLEMSSSNCSIRLRIDPDTNFEWVYGRNPKIQVVLGWFDCTGAEVSYTAFTGFVTGQISAENPEYREKELNLKLDNVLARFKEAEWDNLTRKPLGGRTINAALDLILNSEGLQSTDRIWHVNGNYLTLPSGSPEDPFEYPPKGEQKIETMKRILGYYNMELSITDDGRIISLPKDYYNPAITFTLEGDPSSTADNLVRGIDNVYDTSDNKTCIVVEGKALNGADMMAFGIDYQAEQNTFSSRFTYWRKIQQETLPNTTTLGMCASRAQAIALSTFGDQVKSTVKCFATLSLSRRDQGYVQGFETLGIWTYDRYFVESINTTFQKSIAESETTLTLRRVNR